MRSFVLLALLSGAAAKAPTSCVIDSSEMVDEGIRSALNIWAASIRCTGQWLSQAPVKCAQDVSSSIQSLTAMSAAIATVVDKCDGINKANHNCAWAANAVVSATAGLAAGSAKIADHCAHVANKPYAGDVLDTLTTLGKCTVNAGSAMNSLFEASSTMKSLKRTCAADPSSSACASDSQEAIYILSSLAAYISDSVADCGDYHAHHTHTTFNSADARCSSAVFEIIAQLHRLGEVGTEMHKFCSSSSHRLFLDSDQVASANGTPLLTTLLAAILPVTGVLAFVAGKRFATSRRGEGYDPELLVTTEE